MNNLKEVTEKLAAKGKLISQIYAEAGEDLDFSKVKCLEGDTTAKVEALKAIDKEVTGLKAEREKLIAAEKTLKAGRELNDEMNKPANPMTFPGKGDTKVETKTLGELFLESKAYKQKGAESLLDIELKTIMTATSSWVPEVLRLPRVELYPLRPLVVADFFPIYPTNMSAIYYMEETTFTSNAAEIAEESNAAAPTAYGEAALALTERQVPVEKIAVWLPVSDEQLEDVAGIAQYINGRLTYMIQAKLDGQLIAGSGTPPALRGVLNASNIQSQTIGTDPVPDGVYKAMTKVRATGFAEPSVCFFHPNDWQDIRLLRTADGIYIFGNPTEPGPDRIWGVPVVQTTAETENTMVVGDFARYSGLFVKRGVDVKVTDSHGELFTAGVQAIKATMRCAAVYFRGTAFCKMASI